MKKGIITTACTALGILIAGAITVSAASIVKTEINKTNIERIFESLVRIEKKIDNLGD